MGKGKASDLQMPLCSSGTVPLGEDGSVGLSFPLRCAALVRSCWLGTALLPVPTVQQCSPGCWGAGAGIQLHQGEHVLGQPCCKMPAPLMVSCEQMGMKSEIGNMLSGGINACP